MKKDVVVIGGGIVGLSVAVALGRLGLDILVLDTNPIIFNHELDKDLRVYAINDASKDFFQKHNVWQDIPASLLSPYRKMEVWDQNSTGQLSFCAQELGLSHLGHIIEEKTLKNALLNILGQLENVSLHGTCHIDSICINEEAAFLQTSEGDLRTKLVVGADGANSWLRNQLEFNCRETPYQHHAIVCNLKTEFSHKETASQIFTTEGPLAFLPLADEHHCSVVWSVSPERAKVLMDKSKEEFCHSIAKAFQLKLGKISELSKRVCFPLVERVVDPFINHRAVLVGDALHTIHPLAGLGVNLGLADVDALESSIKERLDEFDSYRTLRHYERSRKTQIKLMTLLMSLLKKSFTNSGVPSCLRGMAMDFISQSHFLKTTIINFATGKT